MSHFDKPTRDTFGECGECKSGDILFDVVSDEYFCDFCGEVFCRELVEEEE